MGFGGGAGSIQAMITTLKNNKRLSSSTKRYKKLRSQYVGDSLSKSGHHYKSPLTSEELLEGRKRAIAYYKKRNRKIYFTIILVGFLTILIFGCIFYYFLS